MQTPHSHCVFLKQHNYLIVSIQTPLTDAEFSALGGQVAELIMSYHSNGAVLDLSGLDVVDSFSVHNLRRLCETLRLYSVTTVITGIRPAIAISMAIRGLALSLKGVTIAADLSAAVELLDTAAGYPATPGESYPSLH
ncbi:MAG: STAS domain-containing protein [Bacillota bacterium]